MNKLVLATFLALTAFAGQAQAATCNDSQIKKEARDFLVAADMYNHHLEFVQDCLKAAIEHEARITGRAKTKRQAVLNVLAAIKQQDMAALVKCESTNTPGCLPLEDDFEIVDGRVKITPKGFTKAEEEMLERDADAKNKAVREAQEDGSRDW